MAAALMTITVNGLKGLEEKMKALPQQVNTAVERAMGFAGMAVKARAQENLSGRILNVKTGHLRGSIASVTKKAGIKSSTRVGTSVRYGAAHEFGSNRNKAVHWLKRSTEESRKKVELIFQKEVARIK